MTSTDEHDTDTSTATESAGTDRDCVGRPAETTMPFDSITGALDEPAPGEIVYHGYYSEHGALIAVERHRDGSAHALGLLHHHVRHSPAGFQWGYSGSGPAETARCLLLDAVDDHRCPACLGTGLIVLTSDEPGSQRPFEPEHDARTDERVFSCVECDEGLRALPYQEFKFAHVAGWGDEWWFSRADIRDWLITKGVSVS